MAVAFDVVGPGASGAGNATGAALTWAHTITGANTVLVAGIAVDASSDTGISVSVTYNSLPMTALAVPRHSGGNAAGFLQAFGIVAAAGTANVVATPAGGTPDGISGGSLSFTGAAQTFATAFGAPVTNDSNNASTSPVTSTLASTTSGNYVAGFGCCGSNILSATSPAVLEFLGNGHGGNAANSVVGGISPSTGSAVTMAFPTNADWWAALSVEVLAPGGAVARTEHQIVVPQAVKRASLW